MALLLINNNFIEVSSNYSEESIIKKLFNCFADEKSVLNELFEKTKSGIDNLRSSYSFNDRNRLPDENVLGDIKSGSFYSSDTSENQMF